MLTLENRETRLLKFRDGKYLEKVYLTRDGETIWFNFGFNKNVSNELKVSCAAKWHGFEDPPISQWSCAYNEHNRFQLAYLGGLKPYAKFEQPLVEWSCKRVFPAGEYFKDHQTEGVRQVLTTRRAYWAYEMGLGKSLMAIEVIEELNPRGIIWCSTRAGLIAAKLECRKWNVKHNITFLTYDGLKKYLREHKDGAPAPQMIIGDECQKIKNLGSQRSQAFSHTTKSMREEYGDDNCIIILMSGTPAPKTPLDWYGPCETLQPGYLKEGNLAKFKERLALTKKAESRAGGVYPELVTWRDDAKKCKDCGKFADDFEHDPVNIDGHPWVPSINEVNFLYKRMKGLVNVKFKKDCTDLPDFIYRRIQCKPSDLTMRMAKTIAASAPSAIQALTLLRELSDGFQYTNVVNGSKVCPTCHGTKLYKQHVYNGPEKTIEFIRLIDESNAWCFEDNPEDYLVDPVKFPKYFLETEASCPTCDGKGDVQNFERIYKEFKTAKDTALIDVLEEHDEVGRLVVYAGFTASINRIAGIVAQQGWQIIRLDSGKWWSTLPGNGEQLVSQFQDKSFGDRVCFLANPGSGSVGLTLHASPSILYYSNTFSGEDRMQSKARIHRLGMDINRGATIIDLLHLPTDLYVLENLERKEDLQAMSMGQLMQAMEPANNEFDYTE